MKLKVFLDTNVLMDILQGGRPSSRASQTIFQAVYDGLIEAVVTSQSIIDASYLALKAGNAEKFFAAVGSWCNHLNSEQITTFDVLWALKHFSGDFEDDAQVSRALDSFCDVFITSDRKLLKSYADRYEDLRFMSPEEFVAGLG